MKRFETLEDLKKVYKDMLVDGVIWMFHDEWYWLSQLLSPIERLDSMSFNGYPVVRKTNEEMQIL